MCSLNTFLVKNLCIANANSHEENTIKLTKNVCLELILFSLLAAHAVSYNVYIFVIVNTLRHFSFYYSSSMSESAVKREFSVFFFRAIKKLIGIFSIVR